MESKFEEWGQDALGVLQREQYLFDNGEIVNDDVTDSLFKPLSEDNTI